MVSNEFSQKEIDEFFLKLDLQTQEKRTGKAFTALSAMQTFHVTAEVRVQINKSEGEQI